MAGDSCTDDADVSGVHRVACRGGLVLCRNVVSHALSSAANNCSAGGGACDAGVGDVDRVTVRSPAAFWAPGDLSRYHVDRKAGARNAMSHSEGPVPHAAQVAIPKALSTLVRRHLWWGGTARSPLNDKPVPVVIRNIGACSLRLLSRHATILMEHSSFVRPASAPAPPVTNSARESPPSRG